MLEGLNATTPSTLPGCAAATIVTNGMHEHYPPLGPIDNVISRLRDPLVSLRRAFKPSNRSEATWERIASRFAANRVVRLVVLGTSVTSGCFSAEPPIAVRTRLRSSELVARSSCQVGSSWSRWLQCELGRLLEENAGREGADREAVGREGAGR